MLVADAGRIRHARAGCWAPGQEKLATLQTSGRQRIDIRGAIDLETGRTRRIEALYSVLALIHVFRANATHSSPPGSQSRGRAGMARPAGLPDQVLMSLSNDHPALLPAHEPVA
ncbi:MAG: hypothetical protein ACR2KT_16405 [Methylocella sp.]|nr:MAG: hypothetical protein DLM68_18905 [Hyphomicrobiales bacterium]